MPPAKSSDENGRLPTTSWGLFADAARRWGIFAALVIALTGVQVIALKTIYESQQQTELYVRDVLVKELALSAETRTKLTIEITQMTAARESMVKAMDNNTEALNKLNRLFEEHIKAEKR